MNIKTLLLNLPYNLDNISDNTHLLPPLGLAIISGFLKSRMNNIVLFDSAAHNANRQKVIDYVKWQNPNILALSLVTHQVPQTISFLKDIKSFFPNIITVVGGAHPSVEYISLLLNHKEIDITVIGEGEYSMYEIINCIQEGKSIGSVKGIAYRENGNVKVTPARSLISDLDILPFTDWESLPMEQYWYNYTSKKNYTVIVFSRGCPFACTFCAKDATGKEQRKRSPGHVIEELKLLYDKYRVRELLIADSILNLDNHWVREICKEMIKMNRPLKWGCQIRADRVDSETVRLMKKSGCRNIFIGVESADNEMLKNMQKGGNIEIIEEGIKLIQKEGINPDLGFIIGLPGETKESIKKTINFAIKHSKCMYAFNLASPFPGTEFYKQAKKEGFLVEDWSKLNLYKIAYVPEGLTKEQLQRYYKLAVRCSYLRIPFLFAQILQLKSWINFKIKLKIFYRIFLKRFANLKRGHHESKRR